jgi:hypothetical protein
VFHVTTLEGIKQPITTVYSVDCHYIREKTRPCAGMIFTWSIVIIDNQPFSRNQIRIAFEMRSLKFIATAAEQVLQTIHHFTQKK